MTFHGREIQSYRDLPQMLYHFQTKNRDEPRPRAGLIRVREFIMKDSYSFDRDEEGLDVSFQLHKGAYDRIFERCELEVHYVEAESGMMGGSESMDYLAPAETGENTLVTCERGDYAADLEIARARSPAGRVPGAARLAGDGGDSRRDDDRGRRAAPRHRPGSDVEGDARCRDGKVVLGLVRGDDRLDEGKMTEALGEAFRPATEDEIREAFGADPGSIGPVGVSVEVVADEALREGQFVAGANETGHHLRGVESGRDFEPRFANIREVRAGDTCPNCGGALRLQTAIEVGHIFKLGTRYSEPLEATLPGRGQHGEAAGHGQLRDRSRTHDGSDRGAAPRRRRHHVALLRWRPTTCI